MKHQARLAGLDSHCCSVGPGFAGKGTVRARTRSKYAWGSPLLTSVGLFQSRYPSQPAARRALNIVAPYRRARYRALSKPVPACQITCGTDYSYFGLGRFKDLEEISLSVAELESIGNAKHLIPRIRN